MGWLDDAEEALGLGDSEAQPQSPQVVRADPATAQSTWDTVTSWASDGAAAVQQTASTAWEAASTAAAPTEQYVEQTVDQTWQDVSSTAAEQVDAGVDAASSAWDDMTAQSEQTADERSVDPREVMRADPGDVQSAWDTATAWASEESGAIGRAADAGWDAVMQEAGAADDAARDAIGGLVDEGTDLATQFATNAETQFRKDPVDFVNTALGGTHIDYDTDSSDGTLAFHMRNVYGNVDADWKAGQGSHVHGQAGADWGRAPYLATDMTTDDQGEITKLTGTGKITIPLEAVDLKAEGSGGYEKTADGYKASFSTSEGVSVDGVEVMEGVHGGIQDHGDHGYNVTAGPHVSIGEGKGPIPGFDLAEGGIKSSTDFSYGDVDGQTTYGAQQTSSGEFKVMGQTVAQVQNTVGVEHTEGPQGDRTSVYDTASGTIGNQKFGGSATGSEGVKYTYGTDAQGNEVSQLSTTTQVSTTDSTGNSTPIVNDTDTYDVPVPDVDVPQVTLPDAPSLPDPSALRNDMVGAPAADPTFDVDQPLVLTSPDDGGFDMDQPLVLTSPDDGGFDVDQPLVLTSPDDGGFEVFETMAPTSPDFQLTTDGTAGALVDLGDVDTSWSVPDDPGVATAEFTTYDAGDAMTPDVAVDMSPVDSYDETEFG